jgi:multiple antibiotic resistance protein
VGPATVQIAGGIVLFLISIKMVFPSQQRLFAATDKSEPYIVPIATPMIAGPTVLATIMFYAFSEKTPFKVLGAIMIAWALTVMVLWLAYQFRHRMSQKILMALEKLMGLILTLMSVEMFLKGLRIFISQSGAN